MARTNRAEAVAAASQPAAASVDALDDLNLDDMFDGDDTLFDGLEIDLDGMSELVSGPNTKRDEAKISQDLDAMKVDLLGEDAVPTPSSVKRRTTKRKIKPPPAPDDDDDDYELPSSKKRRSSKATSKKAKTAKTKTGTIKSKTVSTAAMPPPFPRSTSAEGQGMVAAAGQFGGRIQKKGTYPVTLVRQTSSKSKSSKGSPSSSSSSVAGESPNHAKARHSSSESQSDIFPPLDSTFCGLRPSRTEFYPFMAALPPEPGMKRAHRMFPVLEKISTTLSSTPSLPSTTALDAKETDPLFRLLAADLELQQQNDKHSNESVHIKRREALGKSTSMARQFVSKVEKAHVMRDFHSVCFLLKRQYDFLNQSLQNMEHWCRDNFSPVDFAAVYGSVPSSSKRQSPAPQKPGSVVASLKTPLVKVKVRCIGLKNPKLALYAHVRPRGAMLPVAAKPKATTTKSRKSSVSDAEKSSVSAAAAAAREVVKEVSYADLEPWQRRQRVAEVVAQRAKSLELQDREIQEKRKKTLEGQRADLQKVVENDDLLPINTGTMWKWLEKSAYFMDYTEADVRDVLETLREPDVNESDLMHISGHALEPAAKNVTRKDAEEGPLGSIFVRLQSLLVDEGSDDDDGDEDEEISLLNSWEDGGEVGSHVQNAKKSDDPMLDLTRLSLEERAYIHLRAAGLIDDSFSVSVLPHLTRDGDSFTNGKKSIDTEQLKGMNGNTVNGGMEPATEDDDNDLDDLIRSMQADLADLRCLNNSRIAFLESAARSHLETIKQSKKKESENLSLIAKYNQMLKRQKEAKKSARHKPVKKDGDWVPW